MVQNHDLFFSSKRCQGHHCDSLLFYINHFPKPSTDHSLLSLSLLQEQEQSFQRKLCFNFYLIFIPKTPSRIFLAFAKEERYNLSGGSPFLQNSEASDLPFVLRVRFWGVLVSLDPDRLCFSFTRLVIALHSRFHHVSWIGSGIRIRRAVTRFSIEFRLRQVYRTRF